MFVALFAFNIEEENIFVRFSSSKKFESDSNQLNSGPLIYAMKRGRRILLHNPNTHLLAPPSHLQGFLGRCIAFTSKMADSEYAKNVAHPLPTWTVILPFSGN